MYLTFGKIKFSVDLKNTDEHKQFTIYFKSEALVLTNM